MLAVTRHRVPPEEGAAFLDSARTALAVLAARPGFRRGTVGRATDDPALWALTTEWESVGAYRRALSAYEVKVSAVPVLATAIDEPTAYEVLLSHDDDGGTEGTTRLAADAGSVGIGSASAPGVAVDLPPARGDGVFGQGPAER
ncbi:antibiotic biosynthesis monooxygenase family protein [Motilibacter deserti]|uniref:Antibiotic biosynthesis monooxygenase n=1 Tax=Motilibacter deserti TaxID=2714956 RepID=A0ABX0GSE0_9ACTN|nr:antibiotic biosynthesis monooxygenase family protein [Motilibacter deserti]NHC12599.1 antibiotic biosynthesis monooxygenase [Motilibacter deserti]